MDNKTVPTTTNSAHAEDSREKNSTIEKLKFEVAQEMGIKPKAKNKKN